MKSQDRIVARSETVGSRLRWCWRDADGRAIGGKVIATRAPIAATDSAAVDLAQIVGRALLTLSLFSKHADLGCLPRGQLPRSPRKGFDFEASLVPFPAGLCSAV